MTSADLREQLQTALGGAYRIEGKLGRGGMATVYLARDAKHGRSVALKVLHADLATSLGPERFRREITLAASLQHPHIVSVLDSGETSGGLLWFTMPYVEGESLRQRLLRDRQLPLADALRIASEVADALDYAHRHGVIHRDIKPENILLAERHALVADFGIAHALTSDGAESSQTLTETGVTLGTPAYMSPEQASGQRDLDGRTDVYALGAVLYEMLAGEPPFTGPTAQVVIARRFTERPRALRSVRETIPDAVERAVETALAKAPADRFATAGEFARTLETAGHTAPGPAGPALAVSASTRRRRVPAGVALLGLGFLVGIGALFLWRSHERTVAMSTGAIRLAVLPFENVGDPAGTSFADGMSEEITTRVSRVSGMNVIGRTSALQYRTSGKTAPEFGRTLGVQYVLDGTVRWASASNGGKQVRITPALIRVSDGTQVWGEPYDGEPADVFELQSHVAERVAQSLRGALLPGERRALRIAPTEDLEAYRLYLLGREEWRKRTPEGLEQAAGYFQQAIDRDPKYARAYAGLADAYGLFWEYGIRTLQRDTVYARATAAASWALTIDPTLAEGHAALGEIQVDLWNWPGAERELRRAIDLDPNYASAHQWYAEYLMMRGRLEEALAEASTAFRLDPLAVSVADAYGLSLSAKGRTDEAISVYRAALARDSTVTYLRRDLCFTYVYLGRTQDALALLTATHDTSSLDHDFVGRDPIRRRAAARSPGCTSGSWAISSTARQPALPCLASRIRRSRRRTAR